jgi:hypothetical protein
MRRVEGALTWRTAADIDTKRAPHTYVHHTTVLDDGELYFLAVVLSA